MGRGREGLLCTTPAPAPPLCPMGAARATGTQATQCPEAPSPGVPSQDPVVRPGPTGHISQAVSAFFFFFFNSALIIILYIRRDLEIIKHQSAGEQPG